jgi:hypothetical protein
MHFVNFYMTNFIKNELGVKVRKLKQYIILITILLINTLLGSEGDSSAFSKDNVSSTHFVADKVKIVKGNVTKCGVDSSWVLVPKPTDGWMLLTKVDETEADEPNFTLVSDTICMPQRRQQYKISRNCAKQMSTSQAVGASTRIQKYYIVMMLGINYIMTQDEIEKIPSCTFFATQSFASVKAAEQYLQNIMGRHK